MKYYNSYLVESIFLVLTPSILFNIFSFPAYLRAFQQIPWVMLSWMLLLLGFVFFGFIVFPDRGRDVYRMIKDIRRGDIISKEGTVLDYKIIKRFSMIAGRVYVLAIREKDTGLTKILTGLEKDLEIDIHLSDDIEIEFLKTSAVITHVGKHEKRHN